MTGSSNQTGKGAIIIQYVMHSETSGVWMDASSWEDDCSLLNGVRGTRRKEQAAVCVFPAPASPESELLASQAHLVGCSHIFTRFVC